ncbi:S-adenosyl-L-methionine-dependent methyltransferase [Phaeosphaeria sp. MPI-PUGE-AT-0046c]|nr:S-adenosyl-L-methionine-dependent methyltransferase [Phaeosphaeria sp. MPI-PUGE-AT-0046c]
MASLGHKQGEYPLKRDTLASIRLNFNHFWMKSLTGYLLHPNIATSTKKLRIVDLGAGTGMWACEVAADLPNGSVDAVDISDEQFPPSPFRPRNTQFWTHDFFKPFPREYLNQFDVVNLKFVLYLVNDDVADKLITNVLTLLKPGGHLQWFEPLPDTARLRGSSDIPTPACDKRIAIWKKLAPHSSYKWVDALPQLFVRHDLMVVLENRYESPDHYMPIAAQATYLGQIERGDPGGEDYVDQYREEYRSGATVDVAFTCVLGRKKASQ